MPRKISRREFIKITGVVPAGLIIDPLLGLQTGSFQANNKNILIIVFDAFSAYNISTYGYPRNTTPNISRLSEKAVVYHNHYAGGNFTTPGTASLLTGTLPWTNRAFNPGGSVSDEFIDKNIFSAFPNYHRIAYTHNSWASILLNQFGRHIDELIPRENLLLASNKFLHRVFQNDDDIATVSWIRNIGIELDGYSYSLYLSHINKYQQEKNIREYKSKFPLGIPLAGAVGTDDIFILEQATSYLGTKIPDLPQPFLGYFHFLPPHDPYRTSSEFYGTFHNDGYTPVEKPIDIFKTRINKGLDRKRSEYDEFILYCDKEFGKLYDRLETLGILDNTILVLTSDHGEMNERGISGHSTNALYQPVVRIPLMIFEPGRTSRLDIHQNTSAVDVLPTLTQLAGNPPPEWSEGSTLPPFNDNKTNPIQNIYTVRANTNLKYGPLTEASTMLVRENMKLLYYFGYPDIPEEGLIKLFDVYNDPEEMNDLYKINSQKAMSMLDELKSQINIVNRPYQ